MKVFSFTTIMYFFTMKSVHLKPLSLNDRLKYIVAAPTLNSTIQTSSTSGFESLEALPCESPFDNSQDSPTTSSIGNSDACRSDTCHVFRKIVDIIFLKSFYSRASKYLRVIYLKEGTVSESIPPSSVVYSIQFLFWPEQLFSHMTTCGYLLISGT